MVKAMGLAMALWAALGLAGAPALLAADLSPTAAAQEDAELAALPARPAPLQREPNVAWEDFTASTLVSMPFTAFWAMLGALLIGGVAQQRFPPEFDQNLLAGAAAAAGAASLTVGLVSVKWGGSKDPGSAAPGPAKP